MTSRRRRVPHAPAKRRLDRLRYRIFQPPDPTPALLWPCRRFLLPDSPIRCRPGRRSTAVIRQSCQWPWQAGQFAARCAPERLDAQAARIWLSGPIERIDCT